MYVCVFVFVFVHVLVRVILYDLYNESNCARSKCKRDKSTAHLKAECGCRDHYMPPKDDEDAFPFCDLNQFLVCEKEATGNEGICDNQ